MCIRDRAVTKAKIKQPEKKASKQGLADKIRGAYKAGVKRHRKATQGARVFGKGFAAGAKKAVKFAKDVKKVVSEEELGEAKKKKQPSVHDDYYDPMEDPHFDPHEAEATRGQSGRGTSGKMNVRKKYPVKEGQVKKELGYLSKAVKTMKGKDVAKADKVEEGKNCGCGQNPCVTYGTNNVEEAMSSYDKARKAAARRAADRNAARRRGEMGGRMERETYTNEAGKRMHYKGYTARDGE